MPRKQNGFGSSESFAFKGSGRVDKGKGVGSFGRYPARRRFGTSVVRTNYEQWNISSNWSKWRKGLEIWDQALYSKLTVVNEDYLRGNYDADEYIVAQLVSVLYQGTDFPTYVVFDGYEFPTSNADANTHYVARRKPLNFNPATEEPAPLGLGFITNVLNDPLVHTEQRKYREIWVQGVPNARGRLLLQMLNERLTDGETEASLKNILTEDKKPSVYYGQTAPKDVRESSQVDLLPTEVKVTIPLSSIQGNPNPQDVYIIDQGLSYTRTKATPYTGTEDIPNLVGKIIYIPDFFKDRLIADMEQVIWLEDDTFFATIITDDGNLTEVYGLDPGQSQLPPSMYDINTLPQIFKANAGTYEISGTYIFKKDAYQRFFSPVYLSAELVAQQVETASYSVFPFLVKSAEQVGGDLVIVSEPFNSEINMHPPLTANGYLVFDDQSFLKQSYTPSAANIDYQLYLDVDPWQDEIFTSGGEIQPAVTYACSCPSFSKSIVSAPQTTEAEGTRKINRQRRYPLPTVLSTDRFYGAGAQSAAGKYASWELPADQHKYKMCKHTVAAMFADRIKTIEPSQYPTVEARQMFAEKLMKELETYPETFRESFQRSGMSLAEIVFALAQGLNLDNVETAYVMLNTN